MTRFVPPRKIGRCAATAGGFCGGGSCLPASGGEAIQVTTLPLDVGSFRVASHAGRLAVTLEVFADCNDLACTVDRLAQTKNAKDSGEVFDLAFE